MRFGLGKPAMFLLALSLACTVPQVLAKKKPATADSGLSEQKRAAHALNRLTFGPRPGDVQQVTAMGVDAWIDLQLHPEKISDAAVEARLASFRTLRMSSRQMVEEFPDNQMIRQVMDGKKPMPSDPARRAVFQVQIARMQEKKDKKELKAELAAPKTPPTPSSAAMTDGPSAAEGAKTAEELAAAAAAAGDSSGPAPNNLADVGSTNTMRATNGEAPAAPATDMSMTASA